MFADVAAQVHCRDAIPDEEVRYHVDRGNSLLHLAVSVRGHRVLHACGEPADDEREDEKRVAAAEAGEGAEEEPQTKRHRPVIKFPQAPGDVYLSSPHLFLHGVEYPECPTWDSRIIAVQCR
jgi:hypothetical protein